MLPGQCLQPLVKRCGRLFLGPCRRPAHSGEHAGEYSALHVIKCIGLLACRLDEGIFVAGDTLQYAQVHERAANRHQFPPLAMGAERECEIERGEVRLGGKRQELVSEEAQSDLRFGAFEHRAGEAH